MLNWMLLFSNFEQWHTSRHDNFGVRFKSLWVKNASKQINYFALREKEDDDALLLVKIWLFVITSRT